MERLVYWLYNGLLVLAWPFIWLFTFFNSKLQGSLAGQREIRGALERFNRKRPENRPVIWLHAASAGEFEQLKPLIKRLSQAPVALFQTFTSPTIYFKAWNYDGLHGSTYLPWDLPWKVKRFVKELKPDLFINTRHDLWPNLLRACRRAGIPTWFINANLYHSSRRLRPFWRPLNRVLFNQIDRMFTLSPGLKEKLNLLYDGSVEVVGDTRFDQVQERARAHRTTFLPSEFVQGRQVVVYGSLVPSDLEVVVEGICRSLETSDLYHVLVPHEVDEKDLIPWEVAFFRRKHKVLRWSEKEHYKGERLLIWDQVGQLADLYKEARLAYVGAGFSTGVHSVTEPAVYGVPVAHGPEFDLLAEAVELVELGLSTVVRTGAELAEFLTLAENKPAWEAKHRQLLEYVEHRLGATDRIYREIVRYLRLPEASNSQS